MPDPRTVAALFVDPRGCYAGLPGVDLWNAKRDARLYPGPYPVVAHPPCQVWCRLAGLVEARWGHKRGEDGGMFASALASVRRWGGVLEHPAWSDAWEAHGLLAPPTGGGWVARLFDPGWTCYVEQGRYGHLAKKATWLYYVGDRPPPALRWGHQPDSDPSAVAWRLPPRPRALVSWCGNPTKAGDKRPRLGKRAASATPPEFRDVLIAMARGARDG